MVDEQGPFTETFLKVVRQYVRYYNGHSFEFTLDKKHPISVGDSGRTVAVRVKHAETVFRRVFTEGSLGLGESYCEGLIDVEDSDYKYFLFIFIRTLFNKTLLSRLSLIDLYRIANGNINQAYFSRGNKHDDINCHYSLSDWFDNEQDSNDFYAYWLDSPYFHYSCALWDQNTRTVEEAQTNKCEVYASRLGINGNCKGKQLLDLGCGWGGFIFYMAEKYGIRCKGLTLSKAQAKYVEGQIHERHLYHLVSVEVDDIHNMSGSYDYIVSIGVLEHINDYDHLYRKTAECLKANGSALFHSMFHRSWFYRGDAFMLKYIFIRGGTPHLKSSMKLFQKYFQHVDRSDLPDLSYSKTVQCWYDKFCAREDEIREHLKEKSKCRDIDFAVRTFKHYLMLGYCAQAERGLVSNFLLRGPRVRPRKK
jgi:cyclopropane-fatty-acyl-phospholipid synthase